MKQIGSLVLGMACVLAACGISAGEDSAAQLQRAARSPYSLKRYVDQTRKFDPGPLWQTLGIPAPEDFGRCDPDDDGGCSAEIFPVDLGLAGHTHVLLRLDHGFQYDYVYLLFDRPTSGRKVGGWRFLGQEDCRMSRYFAPTHRIAVLGGKRWLVFREQAGSGSGYYAAVQEWYDVENGKLLRVLGLLSDGEENHGPADLSRSYRLTVEAYSSLGGRNRFRVRYWIAFAGESEDGDRLDLGTVAKTAEYAPDGKDGEFKLDPTRSQITEDQIDTLFETDTLQSEDFLRFDIAALREIARGTNSVSRKWLQEFLEHRDDTPEREELLRLLQRSR